MDKEITMWLMSNISFGVLFVYLLLDTRKESKEREAELRKTIIHNQEIINKCQDNIKEYNASLKDLSNKVEIVEDIKNDVDDLKKILS